ncbi:MAG: hypothetical protein PF693_06135 [Spirochaetia bacterium]|jgi:ABC-type sugar transport system ATPase subunit|nr:hypothetical protein [Spirochaetia bacterium]
MASILLEGISKSFPGVKALKNINQKIETGTFLLSLVLRVVERLLCYEP